jgi:NitT/TauT family transport system substrate-binding protein
MTTRRVTVSVRKRLLALAGSAVLVLAACQSGTPGSSAGASAGASGGGGANLTPLKFQLQWVAQAQFAGYYAAADQGYYKDQGLDVQLLLGGPQVNNVQVVSTGSAEIGTAWLPNMLQAREGGADLVSIAQVFQKSGTRMVAFKSSNIAAPKDFAGKKIGSWLGGNEPELFAALTKAGLDPTKENVIKQNFDMSGLLKGDLDVAQAMIYNEYAQVLEAKNPATGNLYQPGDLNVIDFNDPSIGTAMLQDQIFARASWLKDHEDLAVKFLTASFKGWIYYRDNPDKCVQIVLNKGSQLGASHQAWQMNEINGLVWPSPNGIGMLDKTLYDQTISIATTYKVLKAAPTSDATRTDLAKKALDALGSSVDTRGAGFQKATVSLKEGGN